MNKYLRVARAAGISSQCLALLVAACALVACTTQEAKTGTGGSGGTASGLGGMTGGGTGGAGGGSYAVNDGVLCPLPAQPLITDFTYVAPDGGVADAAVATQYNHFGDTTTLGGSEFAYPLDGTWPVTSDVSGSNWHIFGTLGTYSGFGLYFDNCTHVNASAYAGISFTISGSVALGGMVTMGVGTLKNVIAASWLLAHPVAGGTTPDPAAPGRCIPVATTATNQYTQSECADATKTVPVTATPTTISIRWADFTGGKPEPGVTPSDITNVYWFFPPPAGAGSTTPTTYAADITIDDLKFITP